VNMLSINLFGYVLIYFGAKQKTKLLGGRLPSAKNS